MTDKEHTIRMPSGQGGLQTFQEQTESKIQIEPYWVVIMIIATIVGSVILRLIIIY